MGIFLQPQWLRSQLRREKSESHSFLHGVADVAVVEVLGMSAAVTLGWLLGASLAANAALGWAYLGQRDMATAARGDVLAMQQQRDGAQLAASECSDAVDDLRELADQRASQAAAARAEAAAVAIQHSKRADVILTTPAAVPGDDCRSAQVRVSEWLAGRLQK